MTHGTQTVRAPAKINLTLQLKGVRPDGYHELESWVVRVDLADELTFAPASDFRLDVTGDDSIAPDERNLVYRAAHLLAERAGVEPSVHIQLTKRIPAGAGLGGGSSDAAATLLALNRLWGLDRTASDLAAIGAELGSDIPLFVHGRQLVMRGRGDIVEPMDREIAGWAVLICPSLRVATGEAYAAYRHVGEQQERSRPWESGQLDCDAIMPQLFNDLESAAFTVEPTLQAMHAKLNGLNDRTVRVTGSGSAMFALFARNSEGEAWASAAQSVAPDAAISVQQILTNTNADQI